MKPFTDKIQRRLNGFSRRILILFKLNWIRLVFIERRSFMRLLMNEEIIF